MEQKQDTVLVVDDADSNIACLVGVLGEDYDVSVALDGPTAIDEATLRPPDLILLDIMMPGMDGYEVCRRLKDDARTSKIPVIFLTSVDEADSKTRGFELGAVDYITKPFNNAELKARVKTHLALERATEQLRRQNETLELKVQERTREIALTRDVTFHALATMVEHRSPETGAHVFRTQKYVQLLALELRGSPNCPELLSTEYMELLYKSAPLHDIGKVGVPDTILLKPSALTPAEFEKMKLHTVLGRDAFLVPEARMGTSPFLTVAREIIYSHHERFDGKGYPEGLRDSKIPLAGRIMAVADVYDALVSDRVYKSAMTHDEAAGIIKAGSGTQFDPEIVLAFLNCSEEIRKIATTYADADLAASLPTAEDSKGGVP